MNENNKLQIVYLKAGQLQPLAGNPRQTKDPDTIRKLARLIKAHGFRVPLEVYKETTGKYSIVCGNHRFKGVNC